MCEMLFRKIEIIEAAQIKFAVKGCAFNTDSYASPLFIFVGRTLESVTGLFFGATQEIDSGTREGYVRME